MNIKTFPLRPFFFYFLILFLVLQSCNKKGKTNEQGVSIISLDTTGIQPFLKSYPELDRYSEDYKTIYKHYDSHYIWFNEKGMVDYGESLYQRVKDLEEEGIYSVFPYEKEVDSIYGLKIKNPEEHLDAELLMTGLYLFYVENVYKGIDSKATTDLGWLLPRKEFSETEVLDSIIAEKEMSQNDSLMFGQYFKLRDALKKYKEIERNGGWTKIEVSKDVKLKPKDSSELIRQIRNRLYITGEIENNNGSNIYDEELKSGIIAFQKHHGFNRDSVISAEHISAMNRPVQDYIKTIVVNMERCRWLPSNFVQADELILVNIPSYHLDFYRNGEIIFNSNVVVGSVMHKTVIFSGEMSYLAFSPYWNIPQSIVKNEIEPGIERDPDYLKKRNMVRENGQVRQLPGRNNSLGLVKFMFPNENNIYLHDSPAKRLFGTEDRARSHGCIRVAKARELAITILEDDKEWTTNKIDAAMHAGKESTYNLKKKIPVYIGYFTAWVDEEGQINFYNDVYKRDDKLADLLFYKS